MKKTLQILGGLLLAILVAVAVGVGYLFYVGPRLDASSKAYVDQNLEVILNGWSEQALWERASPEFRKVVTQDQLNTLFKKFAGTLGNLQKYEGSSGEANLAFLIDKGRVITARYTAKTTFENGEAAINVGLIEHEGRWQVLSFYVNAPLVLK